MLEPDMARTPLYKTAETEMLSRISKGTWEIGRRLPNEFELADEFGVSQGTMRRALISLEEMGYLSRKPGRGTLVATATPQEAGLAPAPAPRLETASGADLSLSVFRARSGHRAASPAEADLMGAARLSYIERTLKSGAARAAVDEIVIPEALAGKLSEDAPADLLGFLDSHGLAPTRITAEAHAEITDMALSVALSVDRHTALLCLRLTAHDASGAAIARQTLKLALPGARLTLA